MSPRILVLALANLLPKIVSFELSSVVAVIRMQLEF